MLTIIGSLLGFATSFLPKVMDYFQDKSDKKHELDMIAAQTDAQVKLEGVRLRATAIEADVREVESLHKELATSINKASKFFVNLSVSIRPVVTYFFVVEYICINAAIAVLLFKQDGITLATLHQILDEEFMGMLSMVLSFWFGSRELRRREGRV